MIDRLKQMIEDLKASEDYMIKAMNILGEKGPYGPQYERNLEYQKTLNEVIEFLTGGHNE